MKKVATIVLSLLSFSIHAQVHLGTITPNGGGEYQYQGVDEISPFQRQAIMDMLKANVQMLKQSGVQLKQDPSQLVSFAWPLRKAAGFTDNGYYGISNYIDRSTSPPQLLDYNCGTRTYSLHRGTDIFTWPFPWAKMATSAVEVVAAANGVIIGKSDGHPDQSCAMCSTCPWNAVYVQQADGSIAWYGHLKTGSVTTKSIGQNVVTGEYLGVVGSSGNSTGPHLHLEISLNNVIVDPWNGSCNSNASWWASQEDYRMSTLNALMTHSAPPQPGGCVAQEVVNQKSNFVPGETIYLGSYYRDQQAGQVANHKIYYPDNTLWQSWTQGLASTFNASWWYFSRVLPLSGNIFGTWKYEVTYNTQVVTTNFTVAPQSVADLLFTGVQVSPLTIPAGGTVLTSFTISNSGNAAAGNQRTNFYLSADNVLTPGANGDIFLDYYDAAPISAGNTSGLLTKQLTIPCSVANGSYYLFFNADGANQVTESDEFNNSFFIPGFTVTAACTSTGLFPIDGLEYFSISPNPAGDVSFLNYKINSLKKVSITVSDVAGKEVIRLSSLATAGPNIQKIDMGALAPGVYFMTLRIGGQFLVRKFMKQ